MRRERDGDGAATVAVGEYTWADLMAETGHGDEVAAVYDGVDDPGLAARVLPGRRARAVPTGEDWAGVDFDPVAHLGYHPDRVSDRAGHARHRGRRVRAAVADWLRDTPVVKDRYGWEAFKVEYYYDDDWVTPLDDRGRIVPFEPADYLGFDPDEVADVVGRAKGRAREVLAVEDRRTVDVDPDLDEDAFFSTADGATTLTNRYDLEKAVPTDAKRHFREVERYWVDKPNAFVVIFHSTTENEKKYYVVGPHLAGSEADLVEFLAGKLRTSITYADDVVVDGSRHERAAVIERELHDLLDRYGLYAGPAPAFGSLVDRLRTAVGGTDAREDRADGGLEGIAARPEPAVAAEDLTALSEYQVAKFGYRLTRDFVGYERIDAIKHDVNVEDISCDGYDSPVFVYHAEYEQLITNVEHAASQLDDFVVKLAQRSGKSISKRNPQVDATLPDGSRAQLTLGREVSAHGTNYTIRQFKDVPFTPVDLVNWHTFSLDEMAYLWLCIENNKSLLFAGGTASGKTTSLNAVSLFVPSSAKIVSIEDTREVELPQRNWIASVTRPAFSHDEQGDVDEFDLLEAALRQRPEYILMGEVRGEEGRTLFQVMSTGHTTLTTFHADSVGEVLKRFTTDPINVSKTMFTALDLVSVQTQTRIRGEKVRRNRAITEINRYDTENDEINVTDVFTWRPEDDEFRRETGSNLLEEVKFDRGWSQARLDEELFRRRVVLAYLVENDIRKYAEVAATIQAFINDPDTILALMARGDLSESLADLREMESVLIDVDPEKEAMVPRPEPDEETRRVAAEILDRAEADLFETYRRRAPSPLVEALPSVAEAPETVVGGVASGGDGSDEPDALPAADGGARADTQRPGDGTATDGGDSDHDS